MSDGRKSRRSGLQNGHRMAEHQKKQQEQAGQECAVLLASPASAPIMHSNEATASHEGVGSKATTIGYQATAATAKSSAKMAAEQRKIAEECHWLSQLSSEQFEELLPQDGDDDDDTNIREVMPPPPSLEGPPMASYPEEQRHATNNPGAFQASFGNSPVPTEPLRYSIVGRSSSLTPSSRVSFHSCSLEEQGESNNDNRNATRGSSKFLAVADPINSQRQILPQAEEVYDGSNERENMHKRRCLAILAATSLVVLAVIILSIFLSHQSTDSADTQQQSALTPSSFPSSVITPPDQYLLSHLSNETIGHMRIHSSPQAMAFGWLVADPSLQNYEPWRMHQRFALATFFHAMDGPRWYNNTHWVADYDHHECEWFSSYVKWGMVKRVVDSVILEEQWHESVCTTNGEFQHLRLFLNGLQGTLPLELFRMMPSLKSIILAGDNVQGTLPKDLAQLTTLEMLLLSSNEFVGSIPTELALLTNLRLLGLDSNPINGTIPPELFSIESIQEVFLQETQLKGPLPTEIGLLSNALVLQMGSNYFFSGSIPSQLGLLQNLQLVAIDDSGLTGTMPTELGQLFQLSSMNFNHNSLTGPIPTQFFQLTNNLASLELWNNLMTGLIPLEVGQLTELNYLDFGTNQLTGFIPNQLFLLTQLSDLYLEKNLLTGTLSTMIRHLTNLETLGIHRNRFSGTLPTEIGHNVFLNILYLSYNTLTGTIPEEVGLLFNLTWVDLSGNRFSGSIPPELSLLDQVNFLDLAYNNFEGTIPDELVMMEELSTLNISGNPLLSGVIPSSLCELNIQLDCTTELCGCGCDCSAASVTDGGNNSTTD